MFPQFMGTCGSEHSSVSQGWGDWNCVPAPGRAPGIQPERVRWKAALPPNLSSAQLGFLCLCPVAGMGNAVSEPCTLRLALSRNILGELSFIAHSVMQLCLGVLQDDVKAVLYGIVNLFCGSF